MVPSVDSGRARRMAGTRAQCKLIPPYTENTEAVRSWPTLKILHVIPSVAPRYGGPSKAVYTMCRALQDRGIEVLIATTNADGGGELPVALGEKIVYQGAPTIFFPGSGARR